MKLYIPFTLVVCILMVSTTAGPATAGVEPSPFKDRTVANRVNVATHHLETIEPRLGRLLDSMEDPVPGNPTASYENKMIVLHKSAISSLDTARSVYDMVGDMLNRDNDWIDTQPSLDDLIEEAESLLRNATLGVLNLTLTEDFEDAYYGFYDTVQDIRDVAYDLKMTIFEDLMIEDEY